MVKLLRPVFKISNGIINDVMKNKMMEEMLETVQDIVKAAVECWSKLSQPKPELTTLEHFLKYFTDWIDYFTHKEVKKKRLFSDLIRNLTICKFD